MENPVAGTGSLPKARKDEAVIGVRAADRAEAPARPFSSLVSKAEVIRERARCVIFEAGNDDVVDKVRDHRP